MCQLRPCFVSCDPCDTTVMSVETMLEQETSTPCSVLPLRSLPRAQSCGTKEVKGVDQLPRLQASELWSQLKCTNKL